MDEWRMDLIVQGYTIREMLKIAACSEGFPEKVFLQRVAHYDGNSPDTFYIVNITNNEEELSMKRANPVRVLAYTKKRVFVPTVFANVPDDGYYVFGFIGFPRNPENIVIDKEVMWEIPVVDSLAKD